MKTSLLCLLCAVSMGVFWTEDGSAADVKVDLSTNAYHPTEDPLISRWVTQLASPDGAKADQAVLKLLLLRVAGIDELVKVVDSTASFHGEGMQSELDSNSTMPRTVSFVAMYLIKSACVPKAVPGRDRYLYFGQSPVVDVREVGKVRGELGTQLRGFRDTAEVIGLYKAWYAGVREGKLKLESLEKVLSDEGYGWGG